MIDALLSSAIEALFTLVWKFILWPVALVVATPLILLYALASAIRGRRQFVDAVRDGYSGVSAFWEKWAF
jgi:hypothetical protein